MDEIEGVVGQGQMAESCECHSLADEGFGLLSVPVIAEEG